MVSDDVKSLLDSYQVKLNDLVNSYETKLAGISPQLDQVKTENPITNFLVNAAFNARLESIRQSMLNVVNKVLQEASFLVSTSFGNLQADLYSDINRLPQGAVTDSDELSGLVTSMFTDAQNRISALQQDQTDQVDLELTSLLDGIPLIQPTGQAIIPSPIVLDKNNSFSIEVKNIGGVPWHGWLGVLLFDEYHKQEDFRYGAPTISLLKLGESVSLSREVMVPKVWKTKSGDPMNAGKTISTKLYIMTQTQ